MAASVSPNDLLILLDVGRTGRFTRAAEVRGLNHTTIARRIAALERALGGKVLTRTSGAWVLTPLGQQAVAAAEQVSEAVAVLTAGQGREAPLEDIVRLSAPDAFTVHVAAPAAARVRQRHPGVTVEIIAATRRAGTQRSGSDVEVVVGKPDVLRAEAHRLGAYELGLFGSAEYFRDHPAPTSTAGLTRHRLVYFVPSMLQVDALDVGRRLLPEMQDAVTSTNVMAHVAATRAGAGLGLLPTFLAAQHPELERVLADEVSMVLDYWVVSRLDGMRRPAVAALLQEIAATVGRMSDPGGRLR
ncbi:LysR family transcriptional regulator [Nakamurella alba]|nr:LysR family transcriptional regulator [Nakamurella alba]